MWKCLHRGSRPYWVRSLIGIVGNEAVDELTTEGGGQGTFASQNCYPPTEDNGILFDSPITHRRRNKGNWKVAKKASSKASKMGSGDLKTTEITQYMILFISFISGSYTHQEDIIRPSFSPKMFQINLSNIICTSHSVEGLGRLHYN